MLAYGVIVDVERYPEFVPACKKVEVLQRCTNGDVTAAVSVSGRVAGKRLSETFVTHNRHQIPSAVDMSLTQGPFERLEGHWRVTPLGDIGCRVEMHIDVVPKGILATMLMGLLNPMANRIVDVFVQRIVDVYAQESQ